MTDDTRTRLQEAITTAREAIWDVGKRPGVMTVPEAVDRYGELVAMEARYDAVDRIDRMTAFPRVYSAVQIVRMERSSGAAAAVSWPRRSQASRSAHDPLVRRLPPHDCAGQVGCR